MYTNYYDYSEAVKKIAGHRILAVNRGEKEGFLKVGIALDPVLPLGVIRQALDKGTNPLCSDILKEAGEDAYSRLIFPSIEREIRAELTENASESAMKVFATNLKQLLMQPPVKGKTVLGLDPGYRTGCKVAVVDDTGKVLDTAVIYPTHSELKVAQSKKNTKTIEHGQRCRLGNDNVAELGVVMNESKIVHFCLSLVSFVIVHAHDGA